jgi:predicted enzyme related to lactoylglutathione lyase
MDKVVHFEIPFDNMERAKKFYKKAFGWKMEDLPEIGYVLVYATEKSGAKTPVGINGGFFRRGKEAKYPILVIGVASVERAIKKVIAAGGKLVTPRRRIPMGSYARVKDSEGNVIGLADSDRSVK